MHTCLIYIYLYQIHIYITKQVFFFPDFFEFSYDFPIQNYVNKLYHTRQHVQGATTLSKKTPLKKKKTAKTKSFIQVSLKHVYSWELIHSSNPLTFKLLPSSRSPGRNSYAWGYTTLWDSLNFYNCQVGVRGRGRVSVRLKETCSTPAIERS